MLIPMNETNDQRLVFDLDLIDKYDQSGPRYTSYPTAVQFTDNFGEEQYRKTALDSNASGNPLSLYFHIPFCDTVCFYCACNKIATKDRGKSDEYLGRLFREIAMQGELFDKSRPVDQLHWGGGTPTFLNAEQMTELMRVTGQYFQLREDDTGEYSIEIDPREADRDTVRLLRNIGFNRMSLGVQDYDERVQQAVNRIQSRQITEDVLFAARDEGFRSISVDLIYGLPFQSVESFRKTLKAVLEAQPDRLSVFNYAHLPQMFKPQRRINEEDLPASSEKLDILQMVSETLANAGYLFIGMDHFARPDDELAQAQRDGTLYRNFQGYSTHSHCDLVGLGVTSIGMVGPTYSQNLRNINDYYDAIDAGRLPIQRGLELTSEDRLRREVITRLICHFRLDMQQLGEEWSIDFHDHFRRELERLDAMAQDGLLTLDDRHIEIAPKGRFLIRNICMVFDAYLGDSAGGRFSKVI